MEYAPLRTDGARALVFLRDGRLLDRARHELVSAGCAVRGCASLDDFALALEAGCGRYSLIVLSSGEEAEQACEPQRLMRERAWAPGVAVIVVGRGWGEPSWADAQLSEGWRPGMLEGVARRLLGDRGEGPHASRSGPEPEASQQDAPARSVLGGVLGGGPLSSFQRSPQSGMQAGVRPTLAGLQELEELLRGLGRLLARVESDELDFAVAEALEALGRFFECRRACIYQSQAQSSDLSCTHEWRSLCEGQGAGWELVLDGGDALFGPVLAGECSHVLVGEACPDLALPLCEDGSSPGCLLLLGLPNGEEWGEKGLELLGFAADLLGGALERARREEQRLRLERRRTQSQHLSAMGALAGGVAHDFNNLLTSIIGCSALLLEGSDDGESVVHAASVIEGSALRAAELTQKLSCLALAETGRRELVDLDAIITEVVAGLRRSMRQDIVLEQELSAEGALMEADPDQLRQVLLTLLSSAGGAMPRGGLLTITSAQVELDRSSVKTLGELEPGHFLRVGVHDDGEGIPPGAAERLFEPYFSTEGARVCAGMELAQVASIVRAHAGTVRADSQPGEGTSMYVYLPAVRRRQLQ